MSDPCKYGCHAGRYTELLDEERQRVTRLRGQLGALQVDRDRATREGAEKATSALELAQEMAAKAGEEITEADVAERLAANRHDTAVVSADHQRLDDFRMRAVAAMQQVEERRPYAQGYEPQMLEHLINSVRSANDKYLKHPMPKRSGS